MRRPTCVSWRTGGCMALENEWGSWWAHMVLAGCYSEPCCDVAASRTLALPTCLTIKPLLVQFVPPHHTLYSTLPAPPSLQHPPLSFENQLVFRPVPVLAPPTQSAPSHTSRYSSRTMTLSAG